MKFMEKISDPLRLIFLTPLYRIIWGSFSNLNNLPELPCFRRTKTFGDFNMIFFYVDFMS